MGTGGGADAALRALHQGCVGCGTQGRPGRSGRPNLRYERSERRREGYPPEGARPRSGLDRVARSRSDAPSLIVGSRETVSMFGTIECISVCTIVASIRGRLSVSIGVTASGTIIGIAVGARRTLSSSGARSC